MSSNGYGAQVLVELAHAGLERLARGFVEVHEEEAAPGVQVHRPQAQRGLVHVIELFLVGQAQRAVGAKVQPWKSH